MPFSTIATPRAKPVAKLQDATRMEGGRSPLRLWAGRVGRDRQHRRQGGRAAHRRGRSSKICAASCGRPAAISRAS